MRPVYPKGSSHRFIFFFWISFTIVIILNVLVWLYLNQIENHFKQGIQERLTDMDHLLTKLINEYNDDVSISLLTPDNPNSLPYLFYQQAFEDIRQKSNLQAILLLSPQGEILVASPESIVKQRSITISQTPNFSKALQGNTVVSDIQEYVGEKFMTSLAPVTNLDGFVTAILMTEARADYFTVLQQLKNRLFLFSIISFLVIVITAFSLFRMIRRSMQYQAEIKDHEHLVQLGTMAATVAHELRNPLGIISATNDLLHKKYGTSDDEIFTYIPKEIKRLNKLIDDFMKLSRTQDLQLAPLDVEGFLNRITLSLSADDQPRLKIINRLKTLRTIRTDVNLLEQALLNILRNATQAIPGSGHITLTVVSEKRKQISFQIADDGPGIEPGQMEEIFKPFFTTKETGSGLGLAITKHLIVQLHGSIKVESAPGHGTTVTITIPNLTFSK